MKKTLLALSTLLLVVLLAVGLTLSASADTIQSGTWGDLTWTLNETTGELVISGEGAMAWPSPSWGGYRASIKSVSIEEGVTSICSFAFEGCTGLTSVTIGNGVTSIGTRAFYGCAELTSITIGNGVTSIGSSAFEGCTGLTSVTIPFVKGGCFGYIFGISASIAAEQAES